jgi:peptidoglycan/LPS O-acetylase OafA/YrhL
MSSPVSYRPEVDGLRAVAVLAIMGNHAGVPWLPGGYLGVDIFFVISGFVITRLVMAEQVSGTFSRWRHSGGGACAGSFRPLPSSCLPASGQAGS